MRALALLLTGGVALAAPLPERPARFAVEGARVTLSVSFPELVDASLRRKLDSGLATTVVTRAYLLKEGASRAESLAVQTVRVAYDLWDEVYVVEVAGEGARQVFREQRREGAIARLTQLDRLAVAEAARLTAGARYQAALIVELNPVSPALLQQVRRWLSRPREGAPIGDADYFGSFVSLFVSRKVGEAEQVLRFRTSPFVAGALPASPAGTGGAP
jgi:hypothetical protein